MREIHFISFVICVFCTLNFPYFVSDPWWLFLAPNWLCCTQYIYRCVVNHHYHDRSPVMESFEMNKKQASSGKLKVHEITFKYFCFSSCPQFVAKGRWRERWCQRWSSWRRVRSRQRKRSSCNRMGSWCLWNWPKQSTSGMIELVDIGAPTLSK